MRIAPADVPATKPSRDPQPDARTVTPTLRDVGDFVDREWSTVTSVAHGLMSAPAIASKAWSEAAATNAKLGETIDATVSNWKKQSATARAVAIDDLKSAAHETSATARAVADSLERANRLPQAVEKAASGTDEALHLVGSAAKHAVSDAIGAAPSTLRAPLGAIARSLGSAVSSGYDATKHAAKSAYDATMNALPQDIEASAHDAVRAFESTASAQNARASSLLSKVSAGIGWAVEDAAKAAFKAGPKATQIADAILHVPGLKQTPIAGLAIAGIATACDVKNGKSVTDATVANVGSTLVGTAVGSAVTAGLTSVIAGAALTDVAAGALGVAAATGPLGWAVAGGVVVGAAVGYGTYLAVESKPGQEVIDGIAHFDGAKVAAGLRDAGL